MSNSGRMMTINPGPFAYANWRAKLTGQPLLYTLEYPLFTDAQVGDGVLIDTIWTGYGPYQLLNTYLPVDSPTTRPPIILRVERHIDLVPLPLMEKTDTERYHGGTLEDEIAALVSLCMGIRLKAGAVTRVFDPTTDPRGKPVAFNRKPDPVVPCSVSGSILPDALGTHGLSQAERLTTLPLLDPEDAIALVRAARLYQDAIWVAESTPELTWLMLVSAAETAALRWRAAREPAIDRLRLAHPELVESLEAIGGDKGEELVTIVANTFADSLGSTKKFVDFMLAFRPPPPEIRPASYYQYSWVDQNFAKGMRAIYRCRSVALHRGIPFPALMCQPTYRDPNGVLWEITTPSIAGTRGGAWLSKDAPMVLHLFEYIIRHALLRWWESIVPSSQVM